MRNFHMQFRLLPAALLLCLAVSAQDPTAVLEAARNFTINYGVRYEIATPFSEAGGRLTAFAPGRQSQVFPDAPPGVLFPGDPGVPDTIAPIYYKGVMPRIGPAWNPASDGKLTIRSGYAMFYDTLANGVGGPLRVTTQSLPWAVVRQASGANVNFAQPQPRTAGERHGLAELRAHPRSRRAATGAVRAEGDVLKGGSRG